jgi:anti-sigma regulatory factor (Ser/Thr protein kinase)
MHPSSPQPPNPDLQPTEVPPGSGLVDRACFPIPPRRTSRPSSSRSAQDPGASRKAIAMTSGTAVRADLSIPGRRDQVHAARVFTSKTLGGDHPCTPVAVLLASELVTNSVLHSDSRLPGGRITVTVTGTADFARVEVRDAGGPTLPTVKAAGQLAAEGGHGLRLVDYLAARWAYRPDAGGLTTWFEVCAKPPS